jgi:hypothetical protein
VAVELSRRRPLADGRAWRRWRGVPGAPSAVSPALRRALAMLLLPCSLLPVALLAPTLVRAPALLARRSERTAARLLAPAHVRPPRSEPARYPPGASRLERDLFAPVAGPLTPQVGVSPLAEHQTPAERVHAATPLITGEPQGGSR